MTIAGRGVLSFCNNKNEAFSPFKQFKVFAENESWKTIEILGTDCGGEFNSNEFTGFCAMNVIWRELTSVIHHNEMMCVRGRIVQFLTW